MSDDDISIGELSRRLADIAARLENVVTQFDTTYVRNDYYKALHQTLKDQVEALQDKLMWVSRLLGSAVVTLIVSLVLYVSTHGH